VAVAVAVAVEVGLGLDIDISMEVSGAGCLVGDLASKAGELAAIVSGEVWGPPFTEGVMEGNVVIFGSCKGVTGLKKGRERFPHPGILTSQPVEISNSSKSIAEKMDRLFKVSRNL
jgi:hypothetical protein